MTDRDRQILAAVARYYTLTREQIGRLCFAGDRSKGRIPRARLQKLVVAGLLRKTNMHVVNPSLGMGAPAPVYFPSKAGLGYLTEESGDERFRRVSTETPNWQHLYHWVAVAETHIILDKAALLRPDLAIDEWVGEWDLADAAAASPHQRYRLYTLLQEKPRLVCVPDAAFVLAKAGERKVFYLEQDRDTTANAERVAAQKAKGYAELASRALHRAHFPQTTQERFLVLMVAPAEKRRGSLQKAFRGKPGESLWRFAAQTELMPETFLSAPIWYRCDGTGRILAPRGEEVAA